MKRCFNSSFISCSQIFYDFIFGLYNLCFQILNVLMDTSSHCFSEYILKNNLIHIISLNSLKIIQIFEQNKRNPTFSFFIKSKLQMGHSRFAKIILYKIYLFHNISMKTKYFIALIITITKIIQCIFYNLAIYYE